MVEQNTKTNCSQMLLKLQSNDHRSLIQSVVTHGHAMHHSTHQPPVLLAPPFVSLPAVPFMSGITTFTVL